MTVRLAAEVDELQRLAAAVPAHAHFGIRSGGAAPGGTPSVHKMRVGPDWLDSTDELDLGVLGLVVDPACAVSAVKLCPPGIRPVTRSLRLESVRALRRNELPQTVVASADPGWDVGNDALLARGSVTNDQGDPLALVTFLGVAMPAPAGPPPPLDSSMDADMPPFSVGELTRGGLPWRAEVWAGAPCGNLGGQVHGGISLMLASRVASRVHRAEVPDPVMPLDLSVEFLRPLPTGVAITAVAGVARTSRRFSRVEGAFYVADRVVLRFLSTAIRAQETVT